MKILVKLIVYSLDTCIRIRDGSKLVIENSVWM